MKTSNLHSKRWKLSLVLFTFLFCWGVLPIKATSAWDLFALVVDTDGNPIEGATILLEGGPFKYYSNGVITTDADGKFYFWMENWDEGEHHFKIICYADGFSPYCNEDYVLYYDGDEHYDALFEITLESNPDWVKPWYLDMGGYITDTNGNPLPYAYVSIFGFMDMGEWCDWTTLKEIRADENGFYKISDINLFFSVFNSEYDGYRIQIDADERYESLFLTPYELGDYNFKLKKLNNDDTPWYVMDGYVKGADGVAIPHAKVSIWGYNQSGETPHGVSVMKPAKVNGYPREDATLLISTTTDENGYYSIEGDESLFSQFSNFYVTIEAEGYETSYVEVDELPDSKVFVLEKENSMSDGAGLVDGITGVMTSKNAAKHYSVSGVEISPNAKGVHIVNGKKVIVR